MTDLVFAIVISLFLFAVIIIFSTVVGGWLMYKGQSTNHGEPFFRKDSSPGAYSINTDAQDFPEQKPDKNEERILKKTEGFLKAFRK